MTTTLKNPTASEVTSANLSSGTGLLALAAAISLYTPSAGLGVGSAGCQVDRCYAITGTVVAGTPFTITFTMTQAAMTKSKIMSSGQLIGFSNSYESVANSTDVGGSGGLGPMSITLVNNTAVY